MAGLGDIFKKVRKKILDSTTIDERARELFTPKPIPQTPTTKFLDNTGSVIKSAGKAWSKGISDFGSSLGQVASTALNAGNVRRESERAIADSQKSLELAKRLRETGQADRAAQLSRSTQKRLGSLSGSIDNSIKDNPSPEEMRNKLISGGTRSLLTILGSTAPVKAVATNAAVGGTLESILGDKRKSIFERFGEGAGGSVKYTGLNRISGPLIEKATEKAGLLPRIIAKSGENVAEDMAYAKLAENRDLTPQEAIFSAALPAVTEVGGDALKKIRLSRELASSQVSKDGFVRNSAGQLYNPETHRYVPESSIEALQAKSAQKKYIKLIGGGEVPESEIGKIKMKKTGPNSWVDTRYTDKFDSTIDTPEMKVEDVTPKITTDPVEVKKLSKLISKGETALKQGGWGNKKFEPEELDMVRRAMNESRAKLGMPPVVPKSPIGKLPANSPEIKQNIETLTQDFEASQVAADQAQIIRAMFSPDQLKDINKLKFLGSKALANGGDIETLRKKYPQLVESVTSHVREAEPNIADDQEAFQYALELPTKAATLAEKPQELRALQESLTPLQLLKEQGVDVKTDATGKPIVANVEPTKKTLDKIFESKKIAEAKTAKNDYSEWQKAVYSQESADKGLSKRINDLTKSVKENTTSPLAGEPEQIKDISNLSSGFRDVYRNFKEAYGPKFQMAKELILDPFDRSKGAMIDEQSKWLDDLDNTIVKDFGIKKGTIESQAVQMYGEGNINEAELVKEFGAEKAQTIKKADEWFRNAYDTLLTDVNKVRAQIYPNNPEKQIPRRSDYYRHFTDIADNMSMQGLKNIFDGPANISSTLAGVSDFTKPKTKWLSFAQKRKGDKTTFDAVGGFLDYLKAATYAKHIDPHAATFRNLAEDLGKTAENMEYSTPDLSGKPLAIGDYVRSGDRGNVGKITKINDDGTASIFFKNNTEGTSASVSKPLESLQRLMASGKESPNNFIEFLHDFANDLNGKTNPLDRAFQKYIPGGRKSFKVINWLNNRVKGNVILGNLSSAVAQFFNVPQGVADAGIVNSTKGAGQTLASIFRDNKPMKESNFIKERFAGDLYNKFDRGMLDNARNLAAWITQVGDEIGTKFIWNSEYQKALSNGVQDAVKFADDQTRAMVAGRGIGEVPLAQKAKMTQLLAPFQLEVANLWHVMGEFVGEKKFGKLATLFIGSYIMNQGAKAIRGSDVSFDPINAMVEAFDTYQEEEDKGKGALKAGGRLVGELLSNIPGGQSVAGIYPEYGMTVGDTKLPTRKDLFGEGDPTRFGGGALFTEGLKDPLYKLLPPFGGQQIKRSIDGLKTVVKGYGESATGKVQTPVAKTPINYAKAAAFGKYSLPEYQTYFKDKIEPLGDNQTENFKKLGKPYYDKLISSRKENAEIDKAKAKLKDSGEGVSKVGKKYLILQDNGDVKTIDISTPISKPKLSGNKVYDKKVISRYKSDITSRQTDIIDLAEAGQISQDEAIKLYNQLESVKKATSGSGGLTKTDLNKIFSIQKESLKELDEILKVKAPSKQIASHVRQLDSIMQARSPQNTGLKRIQDILSKTSKQVAKA